MKSKKNKPTKGEMEVLEVLWKIGPATVRQVHDTLNEPSQGKEKSYTTTLKFMQNMLEKKLVSREIVDNKHRYKAIISEKESLNEKISTIVENTFQGSPGNLVLQILGNHKTSTEELQKIREYLDELDNNQKN